MSKRLFIRAFMFFTILTLALCGFLSSARAQTWVNLGLKGGQIKDIAIDPDNTDKMFAGAYLGGGLYVTTNGGTNWQAVLTGKEGGEYEGEGTFRNTVVFAVKIAPSDNDVVWATHNYWAEKSTDGGANWTHILNSTMQDDCTGCPNDSTENNPGSEQFRYCLSLAIDPRYGTGAPMNQTVYVGTGGPYDSEYNGAVYKTSDGGTSWTKIGPGGGDFDYKVVDIEVDKINNNIVWAITTGYNSTASRYESSVYRTTNGGTNWTRLYNFSLDDSSFLEFYDLVVRPDVGNEIFIAYSGGVLRIWYSSGWHYNTVKDVSNCRALAISPGSPYSLYAAWDENYVSKSDNWGSTWTDYTANKQFLSLAVTDSNDIYGGELHLGVYKGVYSSGNYTWNEVNTGITSIMVWDIAIDPNDIDHDHYLAATEAGVYERLNATAQWNKISNFQYSSAYSVTFDPTSTSTYYAGAEGRFYKTVNGGSSWNYDSLSWWEKVNDIAIDGSTVFIATRSWDSNHNGHIHRSTDGGSNFSDVTPTGANFDFGAVAIDPNSTSNIYVGGGNYLGTNTTGNLYKSTTGGTTTGSWSTVLSNVTVNALLIDPDDSDIIYAGCGWSGGTDVPLYKSKNGGSTWVKSYEGIPGEPTRYGIWGSSASNIFTLIHNGSVVKGGEDDKNILHFDGTWTQMDLGVSNTLYDIWGSSGLNIFAVGNSGTIVRYNGTAWTERVSGTTEDLLGVWSSGSTVFAVGENGTTLRSTNDGFTWSSLTSGTTKDLCGVWGADGSNVFAVGSYGTILFFNGSFWSVMESDVTVRLESVWGANGFNVFAVGNARFDGGNHYFSILYYNGTNWQIMTTPTVNAWESGKLHDVWGTSDSNVYAVGDDGVILHYNGTSWSRVTSGTSARFYGVWGTSSSNIYAVGLYGTTLHYTGSGWASEVTGIYGDLTRAWNAVTDLKFREDTSGNRNIYASTDLQGVYFSPNQAGKWGSLGAPPYTVFAVDTGSVVVGTAGEADASEGGTIWGYVKDDVTGAGIEGATVCTDAGNCNTDYMDGTGSYLPDGVYFIHNNTPGDYDVTASKVGYDTESTVEYPEVPQATVLDGAGTPVDFYMHDPLITVTINGQAVEATGGIFQTAEGTVQPAGDLSDVKWSVPPDNGLLMVQYEGSTTLAIAAAPGYEVQDVLVDSASIGPQTQYIFENMVADREIEVIFILADKLPDAVNDTANTPENIPIIINVLTNDDLGDEPTTITAVTQGSNGAVTFTTTTVTYTPNTNFNGSDSFTYTITDNDGDTDTATVIVTISNVNEAPTDISLSSTSVAENQPIGTTVGTFSTTDPDSGDTHTYSLVSGTGDTDNASFSITGGTLRTAAVFDYETKNSYSIRVRTDDGNGGTYEEAFTITVTDGNDAPVVVADAYTVAVGGTLNQATPGVLENDTDAENNQLTAVLDSEPNHATSFTMNADGSFTYTHDGGEDTSDSFTYHANDGSNDSNIATVTITITEVIVEVNPHHNAGVAPDTTRVPNNTSFAVRIEDSNGIDTTDIESITFTIDDSDNVPPYEYNLGNSEVVRVVKLDPNEDNAHVTKLWAVYDRSKDGTYGNVYSFEATITISVAIKDTQNGMAEGVYCFKVETQQQHDDAIDNLPDIGPVDPADPALGGDYDAGSQVNSGDLEGAKIIYDNSEPVTPTLGPTGELPPFDVTDSDVVGAPMNLQPPTVFNTPIKIFIPCPGHTDVSNLSVYRYNGTSWVLACDASGTVQLGGEGWMVPGSRVNHNNGNPSTIEIKVYHFTGVQGASSTTPPSPPPPAGGGGGGGGCFIATAAYGSSMESHVKTLREFRDRLLLTNPVGKAFVDLYSTYSPAVAGFIANHDIVRFMVRWSLLPLVGVSWVAINIGSVLTLIFMLLLGFGLVGIVGSRRRFRK